MLGGIAMVVIGTQVSTDVSNSPVDVSSRNQEGVPLSGLDGRLPVAYDCKVYIKDLKSYNEVSRLAETNHYGSPVSNLTTSDIEGFLADLPEIWITLSFWIFHSRAHTDNISAMSLISPQMAALNKAFDGSNIKFSLQGSGIHHMYVDDDVAVNCYNKGFTNDFIKKLNSFSSVVIIVCNLEDVNGLSGILGADTYQSEEDYLYLKEDGEMHLGVIYLSPNALENSHTSLIHQMGHLFGIGHPYPSYETCKTDGDMIMDTEMIFRPSNSCSILESSLCHPERASALQYSPGNLYMDISPDSCRDRFTPGQILRMHAMLSEAILSGAKYANLEGINVTYSIKNAFYHALQPDLPSSNNLEHQMNLYFEGQDSKTVKEKFLVQSNPFSRLSEYAMLAVHDDVSSSCFTCIPKPESKDFSGYWIGELNFNASIQGIEITLEESMVSLGHSDSPPLVLVQLRDSHKGVIRNCSSSFSPLKSLSQIILCDDTVWGSVMKLVFSGQDQDICIRKINILSGKSQNTDTRIKTRSEYRSIIAIGNARQTSTLDGLVAEKALSNSLLGTCSSTLPERNAAWSVSLRSPVLIESISFDIASCPWQSSQLIPNSEIIKNAARLLEECMTDGQMPLRVTVFDGDGDKICASQIRSKQGGFNLVECDNVVGGDSIQIQYAGDTGDSLAICNFQLRGSRIVPLLQRAILTMQDMHLGNAEASVDYWTPIDEDESSCIRIPTNTWRDGLPYWKVHLKEPTDVRAILINGHGKNLTATLSDNAGKDLWISTTSRNGTIVTTHDGVRSSVLTISGFQQLCEVRIGIGMNE